MEFKFNFLVEEEEKEEENIQNNNNKIEEEEEESYENVTDKRIIERISCPIKFQEIKNEINEEEITILNFNKNDNNSSHYSYSIIRLLEVDEHSEYDLIPGSYEGGRKVWECSLDLVEYIFDTLGNNQNSNNNQYQNLTVLELGCGHGLPGIAALKCGFHSVLFSDFNSDVLENQTWPTILLNVPLDQLSSLSIECVSGDWDQFSQMLTQRLLPYPETYDLILSAETLYNLTAVQKVYNFLVAHLSSIGMALIASKRYYFGVGGGVRDLLQLINLPSSPLLARIVRVFDDTKSNIREIIEIKRKTNS